MLTGSNYGPHFPGFLADNMVEPTDVGSVFAAVNVESFMDLPEFTATMDKAIQEVKTSARAVWTAWRISAADNSMPSG